MRKYAGACESVFESVCGCDSAAIARVRMCFGEYAGESCKSESVVERICRCM